MLVDNKLKLITYNRTIEFVVTILNSNMSRFLLEVILVEKVALPREIPRQNHCACVELGTTCLGNSLGNATFSTSVT
jgi:hypothetical protein